LLFCIPLRFLAIHFSFIIPPTILFCLNVLLLFNLVLTFSRFCRLNLIACSQFVWFWLQNIIGACLINFDHVWNEQGMLTNKCICYFQCLSVSLGFTCIPMNLRIIYVGYDVVCKLGCTYIS
jgi:hypothetical protein